jgi:TetR/AcrR family transcriptional regulator, transcriptional repressor for nem operon
LAGRKKAVVGKRERLARAAVDLAYRQGYRKTTLADIASESGVPLGNVYYYYRTKDDIGEAVLAHRDGQFAQQRQELDQLPTPRARLAAFVDSTVGNAAMVAQNGCPMGSLSAEMLKEGGPLADRSRSLFASPLTWMEAQFRAMGRSDDASDLALHLLASLQGAMMLTHSFRDPALLEREGRRLKSWIEGL